MQSVDFLSGMGTCQMIASHGNLDFLEVCDFLNRAWELDLSPQDFLITYPDCENTMCILDPMTIGCALADNSSLKLNKLNFLYNSWARKSVQVRGFEHQMRRSQNLCSSLPERLNVVRPMTTTEASSKQEHMTSGSTAEALTTSLGHLNPVM